MVNALAGLAAGADFAQGLQNTYDNSRLNMLSGRAYNAPQAERQSLLGEIASVDPQAAQAQQQQWQSDEDRQTKMLVNGARYMKSAMDRNDPQAVQGAWNTVLPMLVRNGIVKEGELDKNWDPSYAPSVHQLLAMGGPDATGGVLQSQKIGADGYIYNSFRDGRMVNTGVKADRQAWFRDQPGFAPEVVNKDGTTTQIGGAPAGDTGPQGTTFTTSEGQPFDVSLVTDPYLRQEITRDPGSYGMVPDGARAALPSRELTPGQYNSRTRPSTAQEAADTARAKTQVENANFENELEQQRRLKEQEARIEAEKARAVEQAKSEQERASNERAKTAQLNNVDRGLTRIDEALKKLSGSLIDTGPIDGRLMVSTPQGQELEAAVGTIQNDMLALTRVPGIGSQSDLEAKIANLKYPSIYNHPSVNAANVKQLREFMVDLRRQITGSSAGSGGRAVVRTGTSNGRKVIQYSDGSVEYGN